MDLSACTLAVFLCTSEGFICLATVLLSTCLLLHLQGSYGFSRCWRVQFMWCLYRNSVLQLMWVTSGLTQQCHAWSLQQIWSSPLSAGGSASTCDVLHSPLVWELCWSEFVLWCTVTAELSSSRAVLSLHPWFWDHPLYRWLPAFPKSISCIDHFCWFFFFGKLFCVWETCFKICWGMWRTQNQPNNRHMSIFLLERRFERPLLFLCYSLSEGWKPSLFVAPCVCSHQSQLAEDPGALWWDCWPHSSLHPHSV